MCRFKVGDKIVVYDSVYGPDDLPNGSRGIITWYDGRELKVNIFRPRSFDHTYTLSIFGEARGFKIKHDLEMLFQEDI